MKEREIIARFFNFPAGEGVDTGVGDDAAVLSPPAGARLAISTDTLVEGVHFFLDITPDNLARKAAAVSLSDLAAMGARPLWMSVALTAPNSKTADWFASFAGGLRASAKEYAYSLIGGDLTTGAVLSVTTSAVGALDKAPLLRSGAKVGDDVWLSGVAGEAALAVAVKNNVQLPPLPTLPPKTIEVAEQRLNNPVARTCLGQEIAAVASAAIDLSDGLAAAANAIADASDVRMVLEAAKLPVGELASLPPPLRLDLMLNGGDDYELLFCAPTKHREFLRHIKTAVQIQNIGRVDEGSGVVMQDENGALSMPPKGYEHDFSD